MSGFLAENRLVQTLRSILTRLVRAYRLVGNVEKDRIVLAVAL